MTSCEPLCDLSASEIYFFPAVQLKNPNYTRTNYAKCMFCGSG